MNWSNVKLILGREIRDQLRDRRTLFMIAVLPILLYPLMGMSFFQLAQFMREHPTKVLVIGGADLMKRTDLPPLFDAGGRFAESLVAEGDKQSAALIDVDFAPHKLDDGDRANGGGQGSERDAGEMAAAARRAVQTGQYEAVIYFPPDFVDRLEKIRSRLMQQRSAHNENGNENGKKPALDKSLSDKSLSDKSLSNKPLPDKTLSDTSPADPATANIPSPKLFFNTARETSQVAHSRVEYMLARWKTLVAEKYLRDSNVPDQVARPFQLKDQDVAQEGHRDAAIWSKILPFVVIIWALTGAFYPAIDLCAGEKERGTLETLLSSPAERSEIVVGKLLTIVLFSVATSVLNLLSMGLTGTLVLSHLKHLTKGAEMGLPHWSAIAWLFVALLPLAALFSAICLALAAFARSTKEGQYYLMPVIIITLPLMILPMSPAVELTLGNALIPVTGVMLLLRELLQGNYQQALVYVAPVLGVTLVCCVLAVRWAIDQFNSESVLFRESERLDLGLWVRHLLRDREDTPTVAMAVLCGVLLLVIRFFAGFLVGEPKTPEDFLIVQSVTLVAFFAAPALLMTVMLTRSPRHTLLLRMPHGMSIPAAMTMAVALSPVVVALQQALERLYPLDKRLTAGLTHLLDGIPFPQLLLAMAVLPAICEELAFRGFILSGLRHLGHKWRAIVISSVFFGLAHVIVQQSLVACAVGVVIGYLAVQTGSLLPGILFHATHNALIFSLAKVDAAAVDRYPLLGWIFRPAGDDGFLYSPLVVAIGGIVAIRLFLWFRDLPYRKSKEELLQESIDQHAAEWSVGSG
jgi:sodium transport system permease protein